MKFLMEKLSRYGWNEREQTEDDFYQICEDEKVLVFEFEMRRAGMYGVCEGVPVILLNKNLRGVKKLEVAFHELGHHFFHSPAMCLYTRNLTRRHQMEAQVVAVVALMPKTKLGEFLRNSDNLAEYPKKLVKFRLEILEVYDI